MLKRMILAAAAVALTTPAMAACIEDEDGLRCEPLSDERTATVPFGSTMVWPDREFLLEEIERPGTGTGTELPGGEDVLWWDGDDAFVVPENSGAQFQIADW